MRGLRRLPSLLIPFLAVTTFMATIEPAQAAEVGATVTVSDRVSPSSVTVAVGQAVEFVNVGEGRHRFRTTSGPEDFDSGEIQPGGSAQVLLTLPGVYTYEDHRNDHDDAYIGSITVVAPDSPPAPGGGGGSTVSILDRSFSPASISIAAGTTVRWTNVSGRDHTVTDTGRSYDSGNLGSGAGYSRAYDTAGTYSYFCTIHPDMRGVVEVGAAGEAPPPAPPPPAPPVTTTPPPPRSGGVQIIDYAFRSASVSLTAGDTLVWTNDGQAPHTVTEVGGGFDSGFLSSGEAYSRTFVEPGTHMYFCSIHPEMRGVVEVGAAGEPPPPPPPAPEAEAPTENDSGPLSVTVTGNVRMVDFGFSPQRLTARVGDRLVWANAGQAPHTATARDGTFDTGIVGSGKRATTTLTTQGTFSFYCTIHPEMTGTLVVREAPPGVEVPAEAAELDQTDPLDETGDGPQTVGVQGPTVVAAQVVDFGFEPEALTVELGTTIEWQWTGDAPHTVTDREGTFDSGILESGSTWSYTPSEAGAIEYYCTLHPNMVATIEVVEASAVSIPAEAGPSSESGSQSAGPVAAALVADGGGGPWKGVMPASIVLLSASLFLALVFGLLRAIERDSRRRGPTQPTL